MLFRQAFVPLPRSFNVIPWWHATCYTSSGCRSNTAMVTILYVPPALNVQKNKSRPPTTFVFRMIPTINNDYFHMWINRLVLGSRYVYCEVRSQFSACILKQKEGELSHHYIRSLCVPISSSQSLPIFTKYRESRATSYILLSYTDYKMADTRTLHGDTSVVLEMAYKTQTKHDRNCATSFSFQSDCDTWSFVPGHWDADTRDVNVATKRNFLYPRNLTYTQDATVNFTMMMMMMMMIIIIQTVSTTWWDSRPHYVSMPNIGKRTVHEKI
jgi:hypothetical protein